MIDLSSPINRRVLLGSTAVAGAAAALSTCGAPDPVKEQGGGKPSLAEHFHKISKRSGVDLARARWVIEENAKPGDTDWVLSGYPPDGGLEGFTSAVSAQRGESITLYINTTAAQVHADFYRMGYYGGHGGRLIMRTKSIPGQRQAAPSSNDLHTISCANWTPSFEIPIDERFVPGFYLIRLRTDSNWQQWVPFCVRDDSSKAPFLIQSAVATWQAYNRWGGSSLYDGDPAPGESTRAARARVVSFDRPYPKAWAMGAADFFGNEYPVTYHMEKLGLDVSHWTDIDLHARPHLLAQHQSMYSLGHDEYWSWEMRKGATEALAKGTNLAFLGANACFRQVRFENSPLGPHRLLVNYKDSTEDPIMATHPKRATVDWASPPVNLPESLFTGSTYMNYGANAPMTVHDAQSWFWKGCGLKDGQELADMVLGEYNRYLPGASSPTNTDLFAHSAITKQDNTADITYTTVDGGGGVLSVGTACWVFKMSNSGHVPPSLIPSAIPGITPILLRAMLNLYGVFGKGPAAKTHPASGNWRSIYH